MAIRRALDNFNVSDTWLAKELRFAEGEMIKAEAWNMYSEKTQSPQSSRLFAAIAERFRNKVPSTSDELKVFMQQQSRDERCKAVANLQEGVLDINQTRARTEGAPPPAAVSAQHTLQG